jgi:alpha-L-fucosidase
LELDLGKPATFSRVRISEAFPNRVQEFELQRFEDGAWKTICAGTTLGERWTRRFNPVTAQRVRLNITEAIDGPTLWEFQLFQ